MQSMEDVFQKIDENLKYLLLREEVKKLLDNIRTQEADQIVALNQTFELPSQGEMILYHGTSAYNAKIIQKYGFNLSNSGCLGVGIYFAEKDKATRFARDLSRHGGSQGALVKCEVKFYNAKYQKQNNCWNDNQWLKEGHDAIRVEKTSMSKNPEWCIKCNSQIEVLDWEYI